MIIIFISITVQVSLTGVVEVWHPFFLGNTNIINYMPNNYACAVVRL
jgi:hypothetical protein